MKDPVCGMTVTEESAVGTIEYQEEKYGFCSQHCRNGNSRSIG